jgi:hypothetical protein
VPVTRGSAYRYSRSPFGEFIEIVANLAIVVTLGVALASYTQHLESDRQQAVAALVKEFNEGHILAARASRYRFWTGQGLSQLPETALTYDLLRTVIEKSPPSLPIQESETDLQLITLAGFFERVEICVEQRRCDENAAMAQLGRYARNFYCIYQGELSRIADNLQNDEYAAKLASFAERAGGCN